jgi:hypothetical protein
VRVRPPTVFVDVVATRRQCDRFHDLLVKVADAAGAGEVATLTKQERWDLMDLATRCKDAADEGREREERWLTGEDGHA